jgi:Flp pilus assembly pilin Flp
MPGILRKIASRFRRDEDGSIAVEAILIFPILTWCYLATFVYFDAFRAQSTNIKAAYTIADALSRETENITPAYMDSMWRLHKFLTTSNYDPNLRVSVVGYDLASDTYSVHWSSVKGTGTVLTNATLSEVENSLPILPDAAVVIVVETGVVYEPVFTIGLEAFSFNNIVISRPRFGPNLCWNSNSTNPNPIYSVC